MKNSWTYKQYTLIRIIFGIYLATHFLFLLPWGSELFSNQGMLPEGTLSPLYSVFPNILWISDSPLAVTFLISLGFVFGTLFIIGLGDRFAAVGMWYILTCLFDRNPLIANPSLPYVGWLLLAHAFLPLIKHHRYTWKFPRGIYLAAWVAMSVGYSYSGVIKLFSPSWIDGTAISHVLHNPLAYHNSVTQLLQGLPVDVLKLLTWGTLAAEILFLPLSFSKKARPRIWLTLLSMHMSLLFVVRFADLSFGMIILHLFTFDPGWIKPAGAPRSIKVTFDGACPLCHFFVRFVLSEMDPKYPIYFQGSFEKDLESLSVYDEKSERIVKKTRAVALIFNHLGGLWRILAVLVQYLPDSSYDLVAKVRYKLIKKSDPACQVIPTEWKQYLIN